MTSLVIACPAKVGAVHGSGRVTGQYRWSGVVPAGGHFLRPLARLYLEEPPLKKAEIGRMLHRFVILVKYHTDDDSSEQTKAFAFTIHGIPARRGSPDSESSAARDPIPDSR